MRRQVSPRVAYVFRGEFKLAPIRDFLQKHGGDFWKDRYKEWEASPWTTAGRAIADPLGDSQLVGLLLVSFQRRHLRVEQVVVDPAWHRRRIATNLFFSMTLNPSVRQFATISALCPDNNDPAIAWLRHCHFQAISILPASSPRKRDHYLFTWSPSNMSSGEHDEVFVSHDSVCFDAFKHDPLTDHHL